MTYEEIGSGGVVASGAVRWSQIDSSRCPCNVITQDGSGGFALGGSATDYLDQISGGFTLGGSAYVDLLGDVYDSLAGCWPLEELEDKTRRNLDGAELGTLVEDSGVGCGSSLLFDGASGIETPPDNLTASQSFSISCWVRLEQGYNARTLFSRGSFVLGYSVLRHLQVTILGASGASYAVYATRTLEPDRWYHIAVVWDRGTVTFYIDGVSVGSSTVEETELGSVGDNLYIGASDSLGGFLIGNLQEVRLWGDTRSALWFQTERDNVCKPGFLTVSYED